MLLVLEIILTIEAWRRGWKGWALLPLGGFFLLAFIVGFIMGAAGASEDSVFGMGLVFDLACIGVLIGMIAKPRVKTQGLESRQTGQASEVTASELHQN